MKPQKIYGKIILNSRKEKTIEISVKCDIGIFSASSPSGKSKGSSEEKEFLVSAEKDIELINNLSHDLCEVEIEKFSDLKKIEEIVRGKIGANTLYSLEVALIKATAAEQEKELWQFLNENARKIPIPIGNCIGGGLHTIWYKKPEFQEFLIIPKNEVFADAVFLMKRAHEEIGKIIKEKGIKAKLNDENAWSAPLTNVQALQLLSDVRDKLEIESGCKIYTGIDVASSTFYNSTKKSYVYSDKMLNREEQIEMLLSLKEKFNLHYLEDPLYENDFEGFSQLRRKALGCLIVSDDLTTTHYDRVKKAIENGSINALIIKPNQCGSLIEVNRVLKIAKENNIKIIFSHRSGETMDYALADLAFAAEADFIKTGIIGREREIKLKRLISIEKEI